MKPRWTPQPLVMSGVTDPYQPVEKSLEITRQCLEILARFRNPVSIITKSAQVTRDIDYLSDLAKHDAAFVTLSITTLDAKLQRALEPRASSPQARLKAIRQLSEAGIPAGVNIAPVIPGLTDHEIPELLRAAREAGAQSAGYILLRLPHGVKELFADWLEQHTPGRKEKVLNKLRAMHGGELYHSRFGARLRGTGKEAEQVQQFFDLSCRKMNFDGKNFTLNVEAFRRPGVVQLRLFD